MKKICLYLVIITVFVNIPQSLVGYVRFSSTSIDLINQWTNFFATHGPDAKYLQVSDSDGSEPVIQALIISPRLIRDKTIVLAINPTIIIPKDLCYRSFNCKISDDFVTKFDINKNIKYKNKSHVIKAHPDKHFGVFGNLIKTYLIDFIETCGGIK